MIAVAHTAQPFPFPCADKSRNNILIIQILYHINFLVKRETTSISSEKFQLLQLHRERFGISTFISFIKCRKNTAPRMNKNWHVQERSKMGKARRLLPRVMRF